jgi:2-dehydro-3-deoxyphosphogluconate aldolase / (4S)-4-hydroxy-2-oxoglutarate aldolase
VTDVRPARRPVPEAILGGRVIAIARGLDPSHMVDIANALVDGGVGAFEVTLNSRAAVDAIAAVRSAVPAERLLVGAGTVLDVASAEAAVAAGAQFLVMPHTDLGLVEWAAGRDVTVFPGAFTPTEILAAWRAGATAVKLFPASAVGPSFVRELRGPLPEIPLIPTGGVTAENGPDFIRAGAVAVGLGSWLTGAGDPATIRARATELNDAIRRAAA